VTYLLERAWPFAIDAVPLQFGSNILTKVTCQLYYTRHTIVHNNITAAATPDPVPLALNFLDDQNNLNFTTGNIA
tara:strand:- start:61 stop:285 length:225 start_codon:yes stop_codon:yes gene_type:complete